MSHPSCGKAARCGGWRPTLATSDYALSSGKNPGLGAALLGTLGTRNSAGGWRGLNTRKSHAPHPTRRISHFSLTLSTPNLNFAIVATLDGPLLVGKGVLNSRTPQGSAYRVPGVLKRTLQRPLIRSRCRLLQAQRGFGNTRAVSQLLKPRPLRRDLLAARGRSRTDPTG